MYNPQLLCEFARHPLPEDRAMQITLLTYVSRLVSRVPPQSDAITVSVVDYRSFQY